MGEHVPPHPLEKKIVVTIENFSQNYDESACGCLLHKYLFYFCEQIISFAYTGFISARLVECCIVTAGLVGGKISAGRHAAWA